MDAPVNSVLMPLFLSKRNATQHALKGILEIFNNQDNNTRWRY